MKMNSKEYFIIAEALILNHVKSIAHVKEVRKLKIDGILLDIAISDAKKAHQARKIFKKYN